jgi:energy-converting hydrogenase Eha subunit C
MRCKCTYANILHRALLQDLLYYFLLVGCAERILQVAVASGVEDALCTVPVVAMSVSFSTPFQ